MTDHRADMLDTAELAAGQEADTVAAERDTWPTGNLGRTGRPRAGTRRAHPKRRRRILIATALGLGGVWWLGWHSPLTVVEHVSVTVPRGISAESIRMASGISAEDHVPAVDAERVRIGIMTELAAVAGVEVVRSLPHTIELVVTARTPFAAVAAGKGYFLMDSQGVVYDKVANAKRVPVLEAKNDAQRTIAHEVLLALPADLREQVVKVSARSRDDVTLRLRGGATVRWGGVADSALKAEVLAGLMAVGATEYDLSAPLLPTTSGPSDPEAASTS
ncbi:MAG: cell division protein FtsQ/DivIB [Candidatus Nanopelagicales bacterium]